jgi:hypothetical protein
VHGVPLPDGTYDAIVVDAEARSAGVIALELTVVAGPHKGRVVDITGPIAGDPLALLGLPATITVDRGLPTVEVEP